MVVTRLVGNPSVAEYQLAALFSRRGARPQFIFSVPQSENHPAEKTISGCRGNQAERNHRIKFDSFGRLQWLLFATFRKCIQKTLTYQLRAHIPIRQEGVHVVGT
jgi:hypothetical protein